MIARVIQRIKFAILRNSLKPPTNLGKSAWVEKMGPDGLTTAMADLRRFHDDYIRTISSPEMSISLELAALLLALCRKNKAKKVLDLGSGFSSFVLRRYVNEVVGAEAYSVDDDEKWLVRTREYLSNFSLRSDNLYTLKEFIVSGKGQFDLILLDLNYVDVRGKFISLAVERTRAGGFIIFDDVHKREYLTSVIGQANKLPVTLFDISSVTTDRFGRYSILGRKSQ
jgi:predicted O-methyltransferase YrrM